MSVDLRAFCPADALAIDLQAEQADIDPFAAATALSAAQCPTTLTARDGRILLVAGAVPLTGNCAVIHALLARDIGALMVGVTRRARQWINAMPYKRVMAWCNPNHEAALRWAALLGMRQEAVCPGFFDDGSMALLFAKVRQTGQEETR